MLKAFTVITFLCLLFFIFTSCNMTIFPESLVYLQERVDLKKYLPNNLDWADLDLVGDACFLQYSTENGQRLFVFDQDLTMINQKDPFSGSFYQFMMQEHGGDYLFGNLIFDKDLKGPYVFDRFTKAGAGTTLPNYLEISLPPEGNMLVIESDDINQVRYIDILSDGSTYFYSFSFFSDWSVDKKEDYNYSAYANHEFKTYYNQQDKKAYLAFFIKDYSNSRVELYRYDDSVYTIQDFYLSNFFNIKAADFEDLDSSQFFFTQKGIVILKNRDEGIILYDYSGKKIGFSDFYDDHEDMHFSVADDGKTLYLFDRDNLTLSKQNIGWKNE